MGLLVGVIVNLVLLTAPLFLLHHTDWLLTDLAIVLFLLLATLSYLAEATAVLAAHGERSIDRRADDAATNLIALSTGLGMLAVFWIGLTFRTADSPTLGVTQWLGALMFVLGIAFRRSAIYDLGPFFVTAITVTQGQPLARGGIYRIVRHPSETGLLAIIYGASLLLLSFGGVIACSLIILPSSIWRMRREDRCLEQAFGEQFRDYSRQVKSVLPFVL